METFVVTGILISFRVKSWQEKMATVSGVAIKAVKTEQVIYEKKWEFLEFSHKNAVTLRPDNYEYAFDVALPGGEYIFPVITWGITFFAGGLPCSTPQKSALRAAESRTRVLIR